jgi:hypothetical protein
MYWLGFRSCLLAAIVVGWALPIVGVAIGAAPAAVGVHA